MPIVRKLPPSDELLEEYNIVKEKLLLDGKNKGAISFLAKKYNVHSTAVSKVVNRKKYDDTNCKMTQEWKDAFTQEWNEIRYRLITGKRIIIIKKSFVKYITEDEIPKGYIY